MTTQGPKGEKRHGDTVRNFKLRHYRMARYCPYLTVSVLSCE
jgi:hypothetical protein